MNTVEVTIFSARCIALVFYIKKTRGGAVVRLRQTVFLHKKGRDYPAMCKIRFVRSDVEKWWLERKAV